jgi:polar amino acid transport system substrate-binding protein
VIRYGDAEWKQFLDFWCIYLVANGEIERLFRHHMEKLGAA